MKKALKYKAEWRQMVVDFCKENDLTIYQLGGSQIVKYYNVEKLTDYFERGIGELSFPVMDRIEQYIESFKNK